MQKSLPPLDAAWDPTLQTDDGEECCWTPLQLAARGGELDHIREILAANPAAVNEPPRGYYGQTAIQAACLHGHEDAVQMLVDAGADIHFCGGNNFQRNALQIACGHGNEKVVDILLSAGAKVNEVLSKPAHPAHESPESSVVVTRYNGRTALQAAAERGHEHLVSRLLELGADVNAPPSPTAGYTALQAAAGGGYKTILKLLLQHGADINGAPAKYKGYTALQGACSRGHLEIVDLLIKEGANVHALGGIYGDGMALHAAAEKGHDENARLHFKARRLEVTMMLYAF
ncbi:hypothetical protein CGLO_10802 [Colletotrichum gloeosporioides Cg-14]|uniref:Uncharacterized protein n=1 Tax=Colletotrichum gloeosporioides (strain Cg-14) TaxID=1237896 RepID=T0K2G5_COLGC|nr:hypothetical protein CGLO_10802 [Colletotrichum gloeosporioides Cg-14]